MRILFDQGTPAPLRHHLTDHGITTAHERGWGELSNGVLLQHAGAEFDGLILPGGHAPGMRQYLGNEALRDKVAGFWSLGRPVGAICHGVLVLARTRDPETGRSLLYGRRTTCLAKYMERSAFLATAWRLGRYYRTYPAYVEDEVAAALRNPADFERGPRELSKRGTAVDDGPAFVVEDGSYVSARWPGDAYLFAKRMAERLDD